MIPQHQERLPEPRPRRRPAEVLAPYRPTRPAIVSEFQTDAIENYQWTRSQGGIPIINYNPRHENLSPEALLERGYDQNGTPYAPCGRLCRSNGYDYHSDSRQYVCGLPCPSEEQTRCPHGQKVRGYSQRMSFHDYPRLIGPIQRGTPRLEDPVCGPHRQRANEQLRPGGDGEGPTATAAGAAGLSLLWSHPDPGPTAAPGSQLRFGCHVYPRKVTARKDLKEAAL